MPAYPQIRKNRKNNRKETRIKHAQGELTELSISTGFWKSIINWILQEYTKILSVYNQTHTLDVFHL